MIVNRSPARVRRVFITAALIMRAIIFRRMHALNGALNRILKSSHARFIHADMTPRGFWPIVKTSLWNDRS